MNHDDYEGLARALFEESGDAMLLVDPDTGHILDANAAAQRLTGFALRAVMDTRVSDLFRVSAGQWAITFPMPARKIELPYGEWGGHCRTFQGAAVPVDVTFVRLSARPRPVALMRFREANGSADGGAGAAGARLKQLVAGVPDCLWSAEVNGRGEGHFQFLSSVVETIAGRPAGAIGKRLKAWRELIHPEDRNVWDEAFERRRSGKSTQDEYRIVWPDGSAQWVRDDARVVRANAAGAVSMFGVFTNITGWRHGESAMHRLASVVHTAEDAIICQSADGLIVDWNRGAERLYGYTKDEMLAKPMLRLFPPEGITHYTAAVGRVRRGEPAGPYDATHVRKDGERIKVSMRLSSMGENKADGISIIARDVSS
ncbi:MAG TPA: PAS domain S-box protein [Gemmataceae bacterium]|jgi:PAS domain S-box-containing protein|nr:PAS domain S-box protein [Gemmataceae bacterium]